MSLHYYHPDLSHHLPSPELLVNRLLPVWTPAFHPALYSPYYPPPHLTLRRKFHETMLFPLVYIPQCLKQCLKYLLGERKSLR